MRVWALKFKDKFYKELAIELENQSNIKAIEKSKKIYEIELGESILRIQPSYTENSFLISLGDTVVFVVAVASPDVKEDIDFLPLHIDYEERLYAVGKIPGSFIKREGKPADKAILHARMIDRSIRPLFPVDLRFNIVITCLILSVDPDNAPEICAAIGTFLTLYISEIPFACAASTVIVGRVDGKFVLNPNVKERNDSDLNLTVSATLDKIIMVEGSANEVPEEVIFDAINFAHQNIKKIIYLLKEIRTDIGKDKLNYKQNVIDPDLINEIEEFSREELTSALFTADKRLKIAKISKAYENAKEKFENKINLTNHKELSDIFNKIQKKILRELAIKEKKRVDKRRLGEIRPLSAEVGILPRVHGSGVFTRGHTTVLSSVTLGTSYDFQQLDGLDEHNEKRYIHHYNFLSSSVGEARPSKSTSRREIGHGSLAENALLPVLPTMEEFPYCIRVVSEVLSSNGSTSQASVCASTLALLNAGVPLKNMVVGISIGLISETNEYVLLTDIQGIEDALGDMDFKVAGTDRGITAIQFDTKIDGLSFEIIKETLERARLGRIEILENVIKPIFHNSKLVMSKYAPKTKVFKVSVNKIKEVIGPGGKNLQKIIGETGVKIDIKEDGNVFISAIDANKIEQAGQSILAIVKVPKSGEIYDAKVITVTDFGAFVEFSPGKQGLIRTSGFRDNSRRPIIKENYKVGDLIKVEVVEVDSQGRVNLRHFYD